MSRVAKWKLEKTKVKVVFRLQFHATHIPQAGWDKLFISFIPADSGKATAKTTKANVRNGTCKWADPIYETTRLLQDVKSKQYDEKLYKFVVAMGSSRSSVFGEASINLADYADALKPSAVALPLHGCNSGTILHVTVQLLTSKTGFREFEQQRELRERGLQIGADSNKHDGFGTDEVSSSEQITNDQVEKIDARVRFKTESKDLPSLEEETNLTEDYADSAVGFDGSSNTSESLYAEKNDNSSTHEIDSLKSAASGDLNGLSHFQNSLEEKRDTSERRISVQGSSDWVHGWSSDYSMENDLAIAYEENSRLRSSLEVAESSIHELKVEVSSLKSHADEIGTETQKFAHQLAAEIASGEELAKEISTMKLECSKLKGDLEQLKSQKSSPQHMSMEIQNSNQDKLFEGMQARWFKGLLLMEDKIRELQNKVYLNFNDREFRFLDSDMEALLLIVKEFKQGTGEAISLLNLPSEVKNVEKIEMSPRENEQFISGSGLDVDLYQPPDMLHCISIPSIGTQELDSVDATNAIKGKIFELLRELDEAKVEKESLGRKMDQMECYYEALVQELEENQKQMLGELQNLRNEHSTCLYSIATTTAEMESMRQDMNEQILKFSEERCDLDSINKELEKRAVTSEAALRRARLNYSIAVDQLQKDLDLLSFQVLSMFETNENLIKQTFSETSRLCFHGHLDARQIPEESDATKLLLHQNQNAGVKKQVLGGDILLEDMKKSLLLQEGLYQKVEEELSGMHMENAYLDVFSKILQETLHEASADIILMKKKICELAQHLDLSNESKNSLMLQLQTAMDDVQSLKQYKATCIARCSDMALQNQNLEAKLGSLRNENCLLTRKITELEVLVNECKSYQSKYKACSAEKTDLANLLKEETVNNVNLQNGISSLREELNTLRAEHGKLTYSEQNLQQVVTVLEDNLGSLLASYNKQFNGSFPLSKSVSQDAESRDLVGILSQLKQIQHNACEKVLQLLQEKKNMEDERDLALLSSSTANSEILVAKRKFKHEIQNMATKLEASNVLLEQFQLELETLGNKLHVSSEAEEKYVCQNEEILADLAIFEVELQRLSSMNMDLAKEISGLGTITEELVNSKLMITELEQEKKGLTISLQDKTAEISKLTSEHDSLEGSLRFLRDELHVERRFRDKLEGTITDLTSQLNEKHDQLLQFSQHEAELVHLRQLLSDLELEKSRVSHILLEHEECLKKLSKKSYCLNDLESQLTEMHEYIIVADIKVVFIRIQYETQIEELALKLQSSESHFLEVSKKLFDTEAMLNCSLAGEAHCIEENANLVTTVESLRSELKSSVAQHAVLSDVNSILAVQLEEYKKSMATLEVNLAMNENEHCLEVEQLKRMLELSEQEIDDLISSKEELEITLIVLKAKLNEFHVHITSLEEYDDELMKLQNQCNELTQRLTEQIMKTEEFKNLSTHLKELKDKAEAECLHARERKEPEGPSVAMQESLRIAFIKEQYETRLQELRHQLSVSTKHGEEMLWKLQDSLDELENRKKSEASYLKRNEELSLKILELEAELQSIVSEKREKIKAYDCIKAELECAVLSLECCKEEKLKLEDSFQECREENSRIATELTKNKGQLEISVSPVNILRGESMSDQLDHIPGGTVAAKDYKENPVAGSSSLDTVATVSNGSTGTPLKFSEKHDLMNYHAGEDQSSIPVLLVEGEHTTVTAKVQAFQDVLVSASVDGNSKDGFLEQGSSQHNDSEHLSVMYSHLKTHSLRSSMDNLHKELERMKKENSLLPEDDHPFDTSVEGLHEELMWLDKANEELRSVFPSFDELPESGNALERVLALEIELAEALRAKKKSNTIFQSSFLKQHSDEQAVLQSFRYINELIKETVETKGRSAAVERELKDMHDRYSQLSLQFAEVEGERQKLMMTLKNARTSKKFVPLNQSSSASLGDKPL
ncbi:uncharacterized protein LOC127807523 [Diospyros lotus]|uniref:uncharacterized protein LOC127807523 n=1 Tax=Diospyros lotus TaxID=55363 RepID=UPI00225202F9|nr:uncharacterized protein LOC127807523 [Diospyros lotus]XP_052201390.1 uncharacterized protein LOC127807523 [Diospyros lotus]XP_052201391.1 uncharacterized protein LOC127807523 [Diospyros lotus]